MKKNRLRNEQAIKKNLLFELKYSSTTHVPVAMTIFDNKEVDIRISDISVFSTLWTNNPHVVKLAEIYFECMWDNAQTS